ncbi:F17F8.5 [Cucumis melo var. makuwa]|uniref:F17F8.5 n=1 Tax=Cucumis melo var. makuwa TaxID=1194695 RepID=A0A5A7UV01_CUCMM|nr:F17F8.5 [Cucumis melo var. makuwa]TYJ99767.1 F17F8.5 [Cucumis melo var. makuwa]
MSDVLSHQAGLATETFWTAVRLEKASLRQKSRIRWLKLGDQNTTFFHRSVCSRMSRNTLRSLVDSDGTRVSSHDGVAQMAVNYFSNSLGSQEIGYRELSPVIDDIVQFQWSEECCQALQLPISREEVRRVLFSMDSGKAPGPDGFFTGFFKGAWSVVGEDFCDAVLHFFETCYLPVGVNATAITLIPKHNGAERLEDFRLISCCNVLYKCISKILADRLRVWLPSFISSNQSAFVPGRSIIENILLCQELVGGYHLNSGKPRCTLKVDHQKAYDSVNWDFLFGLLIAIGTPLKFGVRQGDPLSPFLFVMVMEVLSRMLNKIPQSFQFHHRCEKVKLTYLTFADDLMIFCAADEPSIRFIRECLQKFGELSGLFANPRKSSIFVAGVNNENASHLAACMGFVRGNLPIRYLGLPLLAGRLRSNDYAPLIQRITSRIRSWTARVLSFAGRLQLVRFVLRSLQVYWASVFVLPAYVHHEVDKILISYLWRGKEEGRGGIKVAWVDVCLPFEESGLGIRDGPSWNIASTLKILLLMLTNSGSLWVAWVKAYILKGRSLWDVDSRVGRSWRLRAILRKREKLKHLVWMKVGNSNSCRVWLDSWLLGDAILEQVGERVMYDAASWREARLSDFIDPDGEWLWPRGGFSIASAWEAVRPRGGQVLWDGLLWGGGNIPKYSFCAWLAIKDRLGTRDRLHRYWESVRRKLWRVLWCATIYFIWNERNHRLHGGQARDPIVIFHLICSWIRARVGSWREDAHLPF